MDDMRATLSGLIAGAIAGCFAGMDNLPGEAEIAAAMVNLCRCGTYNAIADAMRQLASEGFFIVMSVHDEVVLEVAGEASLTPVCQLMAETPPWAERLLLRADGFVCPFYKKD